MILSLLRAQKDDLQRAADEVKNYIQLNVAGASNAPEGIMNVVNPSGEKEQ